MLIYFKYNIRENVADIIVMFVFVSLMNHLRVGTHVLLDVRTRMLLMKLQNQAE